ncbi:hypothetical protein RRG08_040664 [Elysia crispata]|uniref:Uncharacterized protein n=1 Tax=Elysia crispata TaxID=231223 RepID=A0AAE0YXU8_9GAST|nr:hypothetical protein RRG08_040664 [Elysia crispata]
MLENKLTPDELWSNLTPQEFGKRGPIPPTISVSLRLGTSETVFPGLSIYPSKHSALATALKREQSWPCDSTFEPQAQKCCSKSRQILRISKRPFHRGYSTEVISQRAYYRGYLTADILQWTSNRGYLTEDILQWTSNRGYLTADI